MTSSMIIGDFITAATAVAAVLKSSAKVYCIESNSIQQQSVTALSIAKYRDRFI